MALVDDFTLLNNPTLVHHMLYCSKVTAAVVILNRVLNNSGFSNHTKIVTYTEISHQKLF